MQIINATSAYSLIIEMLKVIFKVQKLVLRCKKISCQILARKDSNVLHISPLKVLHNGESQIQEETEFLIIQNDPTFLIQVCLVTEQYKKLGGQVAVNLIEWDEGIHHSTVAALRNSPDRNSLISYTFLYIRKDFLKAQKSLILCSEYRNHDLASMENEKNQLTKIHYKLEAQIKTLKSKKQTLINHEKIRNREINSKKKDFEEKIKTFQQKIDQNKVRNDSLKKRNEQIVRMIQLYGREELKVELEKKFPEIRDFIEEQTEKTPNSISQQSNQIEQIDEEKQSIQSLKQRRKCQERQRSRQKEWTHKQ